MNTRASAFNILRRLTQERIPAITVGPPSGGFCVPAFGDPTSIVRVQVNKAHEITAVTFGGLAPLRFYAVGDNELEVVLNNAIEYPLGLIDVACTSALGVCTMVDAFDMDAGAPDNAFLTEDGDFFATEDDDFFVQED